MPKTPKSTKRRARARAREAVADVEELLASKKGIDAEGLRKLRLWSSWSRRRRANIAPIKTPLGDYRSFLLSKNICKDSHKKNRSLLVALINRAERGEE